METSTAAILLAAGRHRLILAECLAAHGVTHPQRARLRREGWLVPVRPGVLLVGGGSPSEWQLAVAAWMAAGPGAVLSHSTAARAHRFLVAPPPRVPPPSPPPAPQAGFPPAQGGSPPGPELTVIRPRHPRLADCTVHRVTELEAADISEHRGLPVTSAIRTLVDLAPRLSSHLLERTLDEGLIAGLWTAADLERLETRCAARPGSVALRRAVVGRTGRRPDAGATPLEVRVAAVLQSLGPFRTQYQVVVGGQVYVLDIAWPQHRVAVECDGWMVRTRSRSKFDHDRRRGNVLISAGWTVVHLTAAMSDDEMRAAVFRVLMRAPRPATDPADPADPADLARPSRPSRPAAPSEPSRPVQDWSNDCQAGSVDHS